VMSHDGQYHNYHDVRMTAKNKPIYEVKLENGTTIYCTDDHRFMLPNGEWKTVSELAAGEELKIYEGGANQRNSTEI